MTIRDWKVDPGWPGVVRDFPLSSGTLRVGVYDTWEKRGDPHIGNFWICAFEGDWFATRTLLEGRKATGPGGLEVWRVLSANLGAIVREAFDLLPDLTHISVEFPEEGATAPKLTALYRRFLPRWGFRLVQWAEGDESMLIDRHAI